MRKLLLRDSVTFSEAPAAREFGAFRDLLSKHSGYEVKFFPNVKDSDYNYVRSIYPTAGYPQFDSLS